MKEYVDIGPLHGYDVKAVSLATSTDCGAESLVQQQFKDECDVNTIVRRFGLTGEIPLTRMEGVYGDFSEVTDFDSALEAVTRAQESFMSVPAEVRERFGNDPGRLLAFVQTAKKQAMVDELGLDVRERRKRAPKGRKGDLVDEPSREQLAATGRDRRQAKRASSGDERK